MSRVALGARDANVPPVHHRAARKSIMGPPLLAGAARAALDGRAVPDDAAGRGRALAGRHVAAARRMTIWRFGCPGARRGRTAASAGRPAPANDGRRPLGCCSNERRRRAHAPPISTAAAAAVATRPAPRRVTVAPQTASSAVLLGVAAAAPRGGAELDPAGLSSHRHPTSGMPTHLPVPIEGGAELGPAGSSSPSPTRRTGGGGGGGYGLQVRLQSGP